VYDDVAPEHRQAVVRPVVPHVGRTVGVGGHRGRREPVGSRRAQVGPVRGERGVRVPHRSGRRVRLLCRDQAARESHRRESGSGHHPPSHVCRPQDAIDIKDDGIPERAVEAKKTLVYVFR
jgi:hypothetical protein